MKPQLRTCLVLFVFAILIVLALILLRPPTVLVVSPTFGPAVQAVYAPGTVEGTVMMPIASRNNARIIELKAEEGEDVKEGQILAVLEDADLKQTLEELLSRQKYAQAEYERQEIMRKSGTTSITLYEKAKSDFEAATAAVARGVAQMNYLKLISPTSGIVIKRDGEVGELVQINQAVFWLLGGSKLRISAEVDEEDIGKVQPGQKVLIRADAFRGVVYNGTVQSITPKGDPIARSYRVRVSLDPESPLKIGMTTEINIIVQERSRAMLIPAKVLRDDAVFVVADGRVVKRQVVMGIRGEERVEVKSGLRQDDSIILNPDGLSDGQSVQSQQEELR